MNRSLVIIDKSPHHRITSISKLTHNIKSQKTMNENEIKAWSEFNENKLKFEMNKKQM